MDVPYELATTLRYLSNGVAGASYTYDNGTVTASEVPGDIEGTLAGAKSVVSTSHKWRSKICFLVDACETADVADIDKVEQTKAGEVSTIELTLGGFDFAFSFDTATGVMTTKARDEAVISFGLYCYLYDTVERWLDTLTEPV